MLLTRVLLTHKLLTHIPPPPKCFSCGEWSHCQKLSEERAGAVRSYLVQQGLSGEAITAIGLGKTMAVADNGTAAGRQKNRRVELIVSGEVIGVRIGN